MEPCKSSGADEFYGLPHFSVRAFYEVSTVSPM